MTAPLIISYYTPDYADHAAGLVESLEAHGLDHRVLPADDSGTWKGNCNRKASFILEQLTERDGDPVVWVDADARVRRPPVRLLELPDTDTNFAAHWRDGQELLSGTLYFAGAMGVALADAWRECCETQPNRWDQQSLGIVLAMMYGLRVEILPPAYTWIREFMSHLCPPDEAIIEHLQHSREIRKQEAGR